MREIREVPSPEVRLAGLAETLTIVERQLEASRVMELLRLKQQHVTSRTHPDDASIDNYELEVQVTHLLPKVLRGVFLLTMWSTLDACTKDLAVHASRQTGRRLPPNSFRGSFVESTERVFRVVLDIDSFETAVDRDGLSRLARVRAALVHHNGSVEELPDDLKNGNLPALEAEGLYLERDLHHRYFVPKAEYVERNLGLVDRHLRSLSSRVQAALKVARGPGSQPLDQAANESSPRDLNR